jgi:signal transduction histidine kinase
VRSIEPAAPAATRVARLAMLVVCIVALRWLPRTKDGALAFTRAMIALIVLVILGVAWGDLPRGFPFGLVLLPMATLVGTLLGGAPLGAAVAAAGFGASCGVFAWGYRVGARPPFLVEHVTNICIALPSTYGFGLLLAARVRDGTADLASSTEVLQTIREATRKLSSDLSQRIEATVVELKASLDRGDDAVRRAADATAALLAESRRAVPAEPILVETRLAVQMAELRRRLAGWAFRVFLLCCVAVLLRALWVPPHDAPIPVTRLMGCIVAVVGILTLLYELNPGRFRSLSIVLNLFLTCVLAYVTAEWLLWKPGLPPTLVWWNLVAFLATTVVGLRLGLLQVAMAAIVTLVGAWPYAALSWAIPINNALAAGVACWLVWRMPRDLIAFLTAQRLEAAGEIRRRRRLVATLFHDLAGPLFVVQSICALAAEGAREPDDRLRVGEMVERMQSILRAATGESSEVRAVQAGPLLDAMEALFRERLRAKGLVLSVHGPREARVLCREALLTESVLGNLLSNAVKFTPQGSTIELRIERDGDSVVLMVQDRGPGLPADVREALTKGLASISRPGTGGEEGNGYGLMLAQDYVREMSGTLELADRPGGGLSARVRLPAG